MKLAKAILTKKDLSQKLYKTYEYFYEIIDFYISIEDYENAYTEISKGLLFVESLGKYSYKLKTTYYSTFQYFYAYVLNLEGKYEMSLYSINKVTDILLDFFDVQSLTALNSKIRNENSSLLPELYTIKK